MHDNGVSAAATTCPETFEQRWALEAGEGIRDPSNSLASERVTYFARSTIVVASYFVVGSERREASYGLIDLTTVGSILGSDSDLMMFSAELAVLQRGNQDHAGRHSNFVACAEWVGY